MMHKGLASSPTATDDYLYDGAGQRIQKLSASGGTSTLTSYLAGGVEEAQSVNGGAATLTKYLGAPGLPQAIRVGTGGTLSYLASDGLSSVSEALDSSGNVTAQQLYAPYGGTRFSSGTMPTSKGFTGQRADSGSSGLDYYGARYYDPLLGQFASADTAQDGLNRYGYVHGNPTAFTDPSGHRCDSPDDMGCGGAGGGCTTKCGGSSGSSGDCTGCKAKTQPQSDCHGSAEQCQAIDSTFHDPQLRKVLYSLLGTSIGEAFLTFLLAVGAVLGDRYIQWADLPDGENGYTDSLGYIQLENGLDIATAAATLIHEAVESLYVIVYGIRGQASQHMDYVAEWYAGEFEFQKGDPAYGDGGTQSGGILYYGAYGLSFDGWKGSNDGSYYSGEPVEQWELTHGGVEFPGWIVTSSPDALFVPIQFTYDPVGLSLDLLSTSSIVPACWCESGCAGA